MKLQDQDIESVLIKMPGDWVSQRTTYCIITKRIKTVQLKHSIQIIKNNKSTERFKNQLNYVLGYSYKYHPFKYRKIIYTYYSNQITPLYTQGIIQKKEGNILKEYNFILKKHYLKITYNKNHIHYTEYIYFINSKFYISIILIKSPNNYIAISFHSDIKINIKSQ